MRRRSKCDRLRNTNREQQQQALERHNLKLQQLKKQMGLDKSEKELMKQILRATEKQWKAIEAKVNKVRELRSLANVSIRLMCFGSTGGSMSGSSVAVNKGSGRMSGFSRYLRMSSSVGQMYY
jgi:hypothetical protein